MTETAFAPPRLERPTDSDFRGVCTAMARVTGTDVLLWRVLAVVLTFFNGLGLALYLIGMVSLPKEGEERSLGDRLLRGPDRRVTARQVVLLALLAVVLAGVGGNGDGLLTVGVLAVLGVMWWRRRPDGPVAPAVPVAVDAAVPVAPPRRRSPWGRLTFGLVVLLLGTLLLLDTSGTADVRPEVALAGALAVVGAGLVVGSFWGRSPGLMLLAGLLGLSLAATSVARPAVEDGVGDRTWVPTSDASYRLGVGEATLDLRDLVRLESRTVAVDAQLQAGHLVVLLPDDLRVSLTAHADYGDLLVLGEDSHGRDAEVSRDLGPEGRPQLRLDLRVRTGQVEVRRG